MSARRSGSFTVSARDKSSNPLARYSLLRFMALPLWGCLSLGIKFLNRQNGSDAEQASEAKILGISTGYLRTSGHQVTWSFGTKDTYERTRRHNDLSRERPPEFPRAALLIRRFILCGARRVGAGGRNSGAIGATGGCCSNREEVSAPVAALRISPPCDDAGTSLGLPPIWRKGATSPPSVSIQP